VNKTDTVENDTSEVDERTMQGDGVKLY